MESAELLQMESVAGGELLLYRYQALGEPEAGAFCLATTFVTQERNGGWRAQSASRIGCFNEPLDAGTFEAMYTVGGNVTALTTVYGLSDHGVQVSIEWSDGLVEIAPLDNGAFLKSRPLTLQAYRVLLQDEDHNVLTIVDLE
jgi:hypothetical protein